MPSLTPLMPPCTICLFDCLVFSSVIDLIHSVSTTFLGSVQTECCLLLVFLNEFFDWPITITDIEIFPFQIISEMKNVAKYYSLFLIQSQICGYIHVYNVVLPHICAVHGHFIRFSFDMVIIEKVV